MLRDKLLKIMNMIFGKGKNLVILGQVEVNRFIRKLKGCTKFGNYRCTNLAAVGSKLLSMMILFRIRDVVDRVLL